MMEVWCDECGTFVSTDSYCGHYYCKTCKELLGFSPNLGYQVGSPSTDHPVCGWNEDGTLRKIKVR